MTSPGASSVPAKSEPIITLSAPAAMALATSPENLTPPSEMTGTPGRIGLVEALIKTRGNISQAAKNLGISRPTFHGLLDKFGVNALEFR